MMIIMTTETTAPAPASPPINNQLVVVSGTMYCVNKQRPTIQCDGHAGPLVNRVQHYQVLLIK